MCHAELLNWYWSGLHFNSIFWSSHSLEVYGKRINKNADIESLLEIETLTLCHLNLAVNSRAEMEIGRYHWMYPGSKNHQYHPVPTMGDRASPLSSPGKYSLGVNSNSKSTVLFTMICNGSFSFVVFYVLLGALICWHGHGWNWPFKKFLIIFHFLSPFPFHPIFLYFLSLFPHPTLSSRREQCTVRYAFGLT